MPSSPKDLDDSTSFQGRNSIDFGFGSDYLNHHLVEEDILTRIRSLLLSRNRHHPPPTPQTSEEHLRPIRELRESRLDVSAAKSIARVARRASDKIKPAFRRSGIKRADMLEYSTPTLYGNELSRNSVRRCTSDDNIGAKGLRMSCGDAQNLLHRKQSADQLTPTQSWPGQELLADFADVTCFLTHCPPGKLDCNKPHRVPSISYPTRTASRSRLSFSHQEKHARLSHHLATPDDLSTHGYVKTDGSTSPLRDNHESTFEILAQGNQHLGFSTAHQVDDVDQISPFSHVANTVSSTRNHIELRKPSEYQPPHHTSPPRLSHALPGPTVNSIPWKDQIVVAGEPPKTPGFSLHSLDNLSVRHRRIEKSTGHEDRVTIPKEGGPVSPTVSLQAKQPRSPSLLSGASRTSGNRHYLLKPSISESRPVDTGLPVPPILSGLLGSSEISMPPALIVLAGTELGGSTRIGTGDRISAPVFNTESINQDGTLSMLRDAPRAPKLGNPQSIEKKATPNPSIGQLEASLPTLLKECSLEEKHHWIKSKLRTPSSLDYQPIDLNSDSESPDVKTDITQSTPTEKSLTPSTHAEYWGFVPSVKEAVQDAVHVAVRNVVGDAVILPGNEKARTARAYRRAVAESLAEAAKDADAFLRQSSLWKTADLEHAHDGFIRKPCHRLTCLEDPTIQHCNTFSCSPAPTTNLAPKNLISAYTWRGNDCEVCPHPADQELSVPVAHARKVSQVDERSSEQDDKSRDKQTTAQPRNESPDAVSQRSLSNSCEDSLAQSSNTLCQSKDVAQHSVFSKESAGHRGSGDDGYEDNSLLLDDGSHKLTDCADTVSKSDDRSVRSNPVNWIRGLLTSNTPYEPKFTALPSRSKRPPQLSTSRQDSDAPVTADEQLPHHNIKAPTTPNGLSRTINELEGLLNEALLVARRAADGKTLTTYHKLDIEQLDSNEDPDPSLLNGTHKSDGITIAQTPSLGAHPSGWPPTGRASTPYPPNSQPSSLNSLPVGIQHNVDLNLSQLKDDLFRTPKQGNSSRKDDGLGTTQNTGTTNEGVPDVNNLQDASATQKSRYREVPVRSSSKTPNSQSRTPPSRLKIDSRKLRITVVKPTIDDTKPNALVSVPKIQPRNTVAICRKGHTVEDHDSMKRKLVMTPIRDKHEVSEQSENLTRLQDFTKRNSYIQQNTEFQSDRVVTNNAKSSPIMPDRLTQMSLPHSHSLDGTQLTQSEEVDFHNGYYAREVTARTETLGEVEAGYIREKEIELRDVPNPDLPVTVSSRHRHHVFNLKNKRHVSLRDHKGFSLARSHKRQAIARDWSPGRKRFCAAVACLSTALVGLLVGIYAGETPSIQYWIVDFHHYTVLGNVFFFIGLSIPTILFWPLPLLHGRKPYILGAMSLAMPLLFPQALAVGQIRSPYTHIWRVALILPRALMGFCLGFANMNFKGILTDLFGASLQSTNPHQEHVDEFDVRRHGGGMGVWLGLWTWSAMGSIGVGFLIGASIINSLNPAWGFYISITIIAFVLLLNILTPEVRRSAFRRSVAEVKDGSAVSRRLARGEVKMHLVQTGPKWWGEEFHYGIMLSVKMLRQPGFMVMATYVAWMYGQIVLIVLLLGSLCSNSYKFKSPQVGAAVTAVPLGAFIAIPFQKASWFSRDRNHAPLSDDDTYKKKMTWSSHLVRRAIFVLTLPFAGLGYTLSSGGAHIPFILPILFAGLIGFLSNLAMAECHGIIMETFDTSDLQPGMTGRTRGSAGDKASSKRTNYSSFPRVSSAFAITQGLGYLIAALASGIGGTLTRNLGQQAAAGVVAFILLLLSVLLLGVLIRFKDVQIIPDCRRDEMDRYHQARQSNAGQEEPWRPTIIGNPHHSTRRMCILELGSMSRFSEIRRKNRLVDEQSLEALHPNHQMMIDVKTKIREKETEMVYHMRRSLSRHSSRGSRRSLFSSESRQRQPEQGDLGGHVEMGVNSSKAKGSKTMHSSKGSVQRRATGIVEVD